MLHFAAVLSSLWIDNKILIENQFIQITDDENVSIQVINDDVSIQVIDENVSIQIADDDVSHSSR